MGVIDSLSAGYRFLIRRLDLLIIPVLLDLLFWLGPRLSIATLMQNLADWYVKLNQQTELPPDFAPMVKLATEQMALLGQAINLLYALASQQLFHIPTILPSTSLSGSNNVIQIVAPLSVIGILLLFSIVGLWIGVLYLSLLARSLPIGSISRPITIALFLAGTVRHWWRVLIFVSLGLLAMLVLFIPFSIVGGILMLIVPGALIGFAAIWQGLSLLIFIYLYFMVAAIIMDDLAIGAAIRQSLRLVQSNFLRVIGFVLISWMIEIGFSILLGNLTTFQPPVGLLIAILLNAFIGTGLAMALLIFYRSQVLLVEGKQITGAFEV